MNAPTKRKQPNAKPPQDLWNPAQVWLAECNCNRDTAAAIEGAGFARVELERFQATKNPLFALIAPHIAGFAVKELQQR